MLFILNIHIHILYTSLQCFKKQDSKITVVSTVEESIKSLRTRDCILLYNYQKLVTFKSNGMFLHLLWRCIDVYLC